MKSPLLSHFGRLKIIGSSKEYREMRATESRMEFAMAGIFTVLVAGTLVYVYNLFEPLVPRRNLIVWAYFTTFVTAVMGIVPILVFARNPDSDEMHRIWNRVGKVVAILFDLAVASSVWLLLPYASEPLQLLMVIFYSAAISGQVLSTAESTATIIFGVVATFGSAAIFFIGTETIYAASLAIFLLAFGVLLVAVSLVIKHAIRSAIIQKLKAERISSELAAALDETREARDARTRFISAASHDLRQPLQATMLFFHQLVRNPPADVRQQAVDGVLQGFRETNDLLEQIMEHLRLESGFMTPHPEPVGLSRVFQHLVEEQLPAAARTGVDLRAAASGHWVLADPGLLRRILRNLVQNALQHSGAKRLRMLARRRGSQTEIFVIDDGIGIAPSKRETVFSAYTQDQSAGPAGGGMGLGLAIAREMARIMGGDLVVDPSWNGGCAFRLTVPSAADREGDRQISIPQRINRVARFSEERILVIDDDDVAGGALATLLCMHGFTVRYTKDLPALNELEHADWLPQTIITDWHLGKGQTGCDAINRVRQFAPAAKVILMTGDGSRDTLHILRESGFPILWKPIDIEALLLLLEPSGRSIISDFPALDGDVAPSLGGD